MPQIYYFSSGSPNILCNNVAFSIIFRIFASGKGLWPNCHCPIINSCITIKTENKKQKEQ